jgi:hypothetical protein
MGFSLEEAGKGTHPRNMRPHSTTSIYLKRLVMETGRGVASRIGILYCMGDGGAEEAHEKDA